jgi:hypothetical protein
LDLKGEETRFKNRKISPTIVADVKRFSHQIKRTKFSAHTGTEKAEFRMNVMGCGHGSVSNKAKPRSQAPVLIGNLRSEILVVQSAQNRHRQRETDSLDGTRDRRVLVQR